MCYMIKSIIDRAVILKRYMNVHDINYRQIDVRHKKISI